MTGATGPAMRLVIDARSVDGIEPAMPVLGVPLIRRAVLAAKRAGIDDICIVSEKPFNNALLADLDSLTHRTEFPSPSASADLVLPLAVLPEKEWLAEIVAMPAPEDGAISFGNGVRLVAPGTEGEDQSAPSPEERLNHGPVLPLRTQADIPAAEDRLMARLGKDTDGFMSRHFARPISMWISRRVAPWPVTPNQMTVVSMLLGLLGAPFFLSSMWWMQTIGGLLFVAHSVVDGCDGELARLKFTESRLGGLLDFWSDNIVHVAVFACMAIGWSLAADHWWPLLVGLAAVLGAAGSAVTVYWYTLRTKRQSGPVYTSVSAGPSTRASKMLDDLSRRDFIYLVFVLALFGLAHWFVALTAVGAPVFLMALLVVLNRGKSAGSAGPAMH